MLRTSIAVAAALAAAGTLAACGSVQVGSAALVGDNRITAATLSKEVSSLQTAYKASNGAIQLQFPASQVPQQVLSWLVRFRIRDQMAVSNGIHVTPAQSQKALASIAVQAQQNHVTLAQLAVANGLPPDLLPELGRYQAIEVALVKQLDGGTLPTSPSALRALGVQFNHEQCLAAKSLAIRVNPQFGRMDYSQFAVVPAPLTLSAPEGGVPAPSPKPQPTPPC